MKEKAVTTLRERYRSTDWKALAGDLFGTTVALTVAFMLTAYLRLWKVATGEWTTADLEFGASGFLGEFMLAIPAAAVVMPVFYAAWRVANWRYRNRRLPQEFIVWLLLGIVLPTIGVLALALIEFRETVELVLAWDGGNIVETGVFTEYFGQALALTLFPTLFTGVYHRLSLGDWTLRSRGFRASLAVVAVVLLAAVSASAMLAPPPSDETTTDYSTDYEENVSAYYDGDTGPNFYPTLNVNESYGMYQSGGQFACGGVQAPEQPPEDYTPKTEIVAPEAFEVAYGELEASNGTVTLSTRLSVRLSNNTLGNGTVLSAGTYTARFSDAYASLGSSWSYTSPDEDGPYLGVQIEAENVESTHVYVDVVRNGEIHRYVTTLCPQKQEATDGA